MLLTYKYRIYPSEQQKHNLAIHFGHNRFVWNEALRFIRYKNNGKYTSKNQMQLRLTQIKKDMTWLSDAHSQTLQATLKRLDIAFQRFFKKQSGYPKMKKRNTEQSIEFPQSSKVDFDLNCVKLPKLGYVKAKLHRTFNGNIKTCYVIKTQANEYYACFVVDDGLPLPTVNTDVEPTGVDLGVKDLAITSDGKKIDNNKYLKKKLRNLRRAMKTMARRSKKKNKIITDKEMFGPFSKENPVKEFMQVKEVWSKRREKARLQVARIHRDIVNCRNDYLHKISTKLVNNNNGLVFENLNILGMVKNHRLAQAIMDCSWGKLIDMCEYKSERAGKVCIKIDKFFASSKKCSTCGHKYHGLTLNERIWSCEHCGTRHDRDVNAARNISVEGKRLLLQMFSDGDFENQETPCEINDNVDSVLESNKNTAGLAVRGEEVRRELVPAVLSETSRSSVL